MKTCLFCGMEIAEDAKSCRHCGSDENTGWSESQYLDGIDLDDDFDYDDAYNEEFGDGKTGSSKGNKWVTATSILLIGSAVIMFLISRFV